MPIDGNDGSTRLPDTEGPLTVNNTLLDLAALLALVAAGVVTLTWPKSSNRNHELAELTDDFYAAVRTLGALDAQPETNERNDAMTAVRLQLATISVRANRLRRAGAR